MTERRAPGVGLSRRSLLGAAATSVVAGSVAAQLLQRVGQDRVDELGGLGLGLGLVVAQHELRTDHLGLDELARSRGAGGRIDPFVTVALSLPPGTTVAELGGIHLRTRGATGWSGWETAAFVAGEAADGAEAAAGSQREVSLPRWVGFADGLDLEVPPGLAGDLRVHLIRETPVVVAHHDDTLPAFVSRAPRPSIRARATWGARAAKVTPTVASALRMAVVHHTVNGNGYSAGQVPGMLAAIQRSHMDVNGWNDIAYNFLVDRFGQIWEGRAGGIERIVVGGHAAGFNTGTTGVSVLGNLHPAAGGASPSQATVDAVAALIAWKLGVHDVDVASSTSYTAGTGSRSPRYPAGTTATFPRVVGHGDVGSTACPGSTMVPRLGQIRQQAFARQLGFPDVPVSAYFAEPVAWLVLHGITTGVGDTGLFKPHDPVDRAQMATFLWRMAGQPPGSPPHGFPDVATGVYYDQPVRWLAASGITGGYASSGRFEPSLPVTRAQMAAFLHRLAGRPSGSPPHRFPDVPAGAYYDQPVAWLAAHGITDGYGGTGRFQPDVPVDRAQMATFLHRLAGRRAAWAAHVPKPPTARW